MLVGPGSGRGGRWCVVSEVVAAGVMVSSVSGGGTEGVGAGLGEVVVGWEGIMIVVSCVARSSQENMCPYATRAALQAACHAPRVTLQANFHASHVFHIVFGDGEAGNEGVPAEFV